MVSSSLTLRGTALQNCWNLPRCTARRCWSNRVRCAATITSLQLSNIEMATAPRVTSHYNVLRYVAESRGHKARGQGQGQPFRGQNLSRPRTGMLEAKDQGHRRKRSPKKKKVFKNFFRRSPIQWRTQNF